MLAIILCLFRFVRLLGSGHQAVAVENLTLRLQLAAFKKKRKRPVLTQWDRLFWVGLSIVWSSWRDALVFVRPDTVVRWQRERFRLFRVAASDLDAARAVFLDWRQGFPPPEPFSSL
jgi:putative transposase